MVSEPASAKSLTEASYAVLRHDLVSCRLRPGDRLKIQDLSRRLGVSPSAIREALSRLVAEGLVIAEAQKGFRVAPISRFDLQDLTSTRIAIETMCLRRAVERGGIEWETGLVAASHRLSRTPQHAPGHDDQVNDEWAAAHAEYHHALVKNCNSPWLLRLRALLYSQAERYIRLSVVTRPSGRNLEAEHRAIAEAALARDSDSACQLLAAHFSTTTEQVLKATEELAVDVSDPLPRVDNG